MSDNPDKPLETDNKLFSDVVSDITPIKQDTIIPSGKNKSVIDNTVIQFDDEQTPDYLSDEYDPFETNDQKYDLNHHHSSIAKNRFHAFRTGYFESEQILDLHGLNREQARKELIAFFRHCKKSNFRRVSIMPGYGQGILRQALNSWLRQLPEVLAFAESPQKSGGKGVIRILLAVSKL